MGQFQINSTFTYLPDPTAWIPDGVGEVGTYTDGAPLRQGLESGTLVWNCLSQQEYGELYTRWGSFYTVLKAGTLPEESGSALGTYDTVTSAYWHEPLGEARGNLRFNVRMRVTYILRS